MAQTNKKSIKQLERELAKVKSDKGKVDLMNALGVAIETNDSHRAINLYKEALSLSEKIQYFRGIGSSARHLAVLYSSRFFKNTIALECAETALSIYRQIDDKRGEARTLCAIGGIYLDSAESIIAEKFIKEGLELAISIGDKSAELNGYLNLGILYKNLARYEDALFNFEKALTLLDSGDTKTESMFLNNIGIVYYLTGNFPLALSNYRRSLALKKLEGNHIGVANTHNNIANVLCDMGEYEKALVEYHLSLHIKNQCKDYVGAANTTFNIGTIYFEINQYEEALRYFTSAFSIFKEFDQRLNAAQTLNYIGLTQVELGDISQGLEAMLESYNLSMGMQAIHNLSAVCCCISKVYSTIGDFEKALFYANEGVKYSLLIGDRLQLPKHYLGLSEIYLAYNHFEESLCYSKKAIEVATEQTDKRNLYLSLHCAAVVNEKIGHLTEALALYKQYTEVKEQVFNENSLHKTNTLLVQFDTERMQHDNEILRLKTEEAEKQAEFYNRELQLIALHLVEKNEFLKQVKILIQNNVTGSEHTVATLIKSIESNIAAKEEWQTFKQKFDRAHDEFIQRLSKEFPQLTPMELKVAALLRIHMENKDIANLLYASVRTVEGHRLNIRKKLGLGLKDNLSVFLAGW